MRIPPKGQADDLSDCIRLDRVSTGREKKKKTMRELQIMFYLGQNEDIAWETAFQIVLRNCSKEVGGEIRIYMILVKGDMIRCHH